jgi:putative intracellular protease/amidase
MSQHNAILVIVTGHNHLPNQHPTGIWFEEYAAPVALFKAKGYSVTVASIAGGEAPIDPRSLPEQTDAHTSTALNELQQTRPLSKVNLADYDAVFLPGGHGTMFDLPNSQQIKQTIVNFLETGRVVGAVCHGPAALVGARFDDGTPVVKGRKLTSFTDEEERAAQLDTVMPFLLQSKLHELGAEFESSPNWQDHVVVDGQLITGQNPQSSASTAKAMLSAIAAL